MKLSGRNLQLNTRGDDVRLLQWELMLLHRFEPNQFLPIAANEIPKSAFGKSTFSAVKRVELNLTDVTNGDGIVAGDLAEHINRAVGRLPAFHTRVEVEDEATGERLYGLTAYLIHARRADSEDTFSAAVVRMVRSGEVVVDWSNRP